MRETSCTMVVDESLEEVSGRGRSSTTTRPLGRCIFINRKLPIVEGHIPQIIRRLRLLSS